MGLVSLQIQDSNYADVLLDSGLKLSDIISTGHVISTGLDLTPDHLLLDYTGQVELHKFKA